MSTGWQLVTPKTWEGNRSCKKVCEVAVAGARVTNKKLRRASALQLEIFVAVQNNVSFVIDQKRRRC